jgi:tyrosine-protein kinase Etk/Wzc
LVNKLSTPIYKIESSVLIKDEESGMLGADLFEQAGLSMPKNNVENEMGILKSYSLISETLHTLNFDVSYFKDGFITNPEIYPDAPILVEVDWKHPQLIGGLISVLRTGEKTYELEVEKDNFYLFYPNDPSFKTEVELLELENGTYEYGEWLEGSSFKFKITGVSQEIGEISLFKIKDNFTLTEEFREITAISSANKSSTILNLSVEHSSRKKAADFLNALMDVYLQRELTEKNRTASNTIFFIDQQLSGIADSLSNIEDRLENYRSNNRVFNLSEEGVLIFQRLEELEEERSQRELMHSYYKSMLEYLKEEQLNDLVAPSFIGIQDPLLNALVVSLAELQSEKVRLTATFSAETPAVREVTSKIKNTQKTLSENLRNAVSNTENALNELNTRIKLAEREVNRLPSTERNLLSIQRQFSINENIYIYLLEKRAEAEITKASNSPTHLVLDAARSHFKPVAPRKLINLVIGMFLGLAFPIGFITVKNLFNTKIDDPHEVEKSLRVPLIGLIGFSPHPGSLVVKERPRSAITEAFRSLRANMSYLGLGKDKLVIALSSSISGEGKSFCSINLASVYALSGKKCILVGLDLRKPRIAQDFGLVNDGGVSTYLKGNADWKKLLHKGVSDNLDVLLSGPIPPNPSELMLQDRFSYLMEEIKEEYDIIILDCPPVGLVSETLEIFKYTDVNLMILRQKHSEKSACDYINS